MSDITLLPTTSGYNRSRINANFDILEDVVNNGILHVSGGNNILQQDLDFNSNDLLNVNTIYATEGSFTTRILLGGVDYEIVLQNIADAAQDSAVASQLSADDSALSAGDSETSNIASKASLDEFQDIYWGAYASEPALSPVGNPATDGDLYYNTTDNVMYAFSAGLWGSFAGVVTGLRDETAYENVAGQTVFPAIYNPGTVDVFLNGVLLKRNTDYTDLTGTDITLTTPVTDAADVLCIIAYAKADFITGESPITGIRQETSFTAAQGQSVFPFNYLPGYVDAYLNGTKLIVAVDFTVDAGTTITLTTPLTEADDYLQLVSYNIASFVGEAAVADSVTAAKGLAVGVGTPVKTLGYYSVNDGGGAEYVVVAGGTGTDDGGSYHDMGNGNQLELIVSGLLRVEQFGADKTGVSDSQPAIQNALNFAPQSYRLTCSADSVFKIDSDIVINEKGRPDDSVFKLDFTGSLFTGSGDIIIDSCKNLIVDGLQKPNGNLRLRGVWFSTFNGCKFSDIYIADATGSAFTDVYWNDFIGGLYQSIIVGGLGQFNANRFRGSSFRGAADQGFVGTRANFLTKLDSSTNIQALSFFGGDISYYTGEVLNVSSTSDLELNFKDIYWDSEAPTVVGLTENQYVRVDMCHIAGKFVNSSDLDGAIRAPVHYHGNEASVGHQPYSTKNLIPNGSLDQTLASYTSAGGGPIGGFTNGVITPVADAAEGNLLRLAVGSGDSSFTLCKFRTEQILTTGKYSMVLVARNKEAGTRALNFAVGGQFFDSDIRQGWTLVTLGDQATIPHMAFDEILMRSTDGLGYDVEVKYVGLFLGTAPPLMIPNLNQAEEVRFNKVMLGGGTLTLRPSITAGGGSPEGVVDAPPGSLYSRVNGGAGTTLYIKEGGLGNTGWAAK